MGEEGGEGGIFSKNIQKEPPSHENEIRILVQWDWFLWMPPWKTAFNCY